MLPDLTGIKPFPDHQLDVGASDLPTEAGFKE